MTYIWGNAESTRMVDQSARCTPRCPHDCRDASRNALVHAIWSVDCFWPVLPDPARIRRKKNRNLHGNVFWNMTAICKSPTSKKGGPTFVSAASHRFFLREPAEKLFRPKKRFGSAGLGVTYCPALSQGGTSNNAPSTINSTREKKRCSTQNTSPVTAV